MSRRHDEQLAAMAALGRALGENLKLPELPSRLTVHHEVRHEFGRRPGPTLVYAEVTNDNGGIWRMGGQHLYPDQRDVQLCHFPIAWLTGREEDNARLGQAAVRLRFDYG